MSDLLNRAINRIANGIYECNKTIAHGDAGKVEQAKTAKEELELILKVLKEQENDGWIPCSERMPETDGYTKVLINEIDGNIECVYYVGNGELEDEYGNIFCHEITAWQPLPEPYKGDTDATK